MEKTAMNVLYVFADQLSMSALTIYGNPDKMSTSNIDLLAANGVKFENSYCTTPQCSPSRSSILTGLYPHRTGMIGNEGTINTRNLDPRLNHLGSHFREFGYKTGYFGKWHLGTPIEEFGYDTHAEFDRGNDEQTSKEAIAFVESQTDPWLAIVSYDNPHDIYLIEKMQSASGRAAPVSLPENFGDDLHAKPMVQAQFRDEDQGKPLLNFNEADWKLYRAYYYSLIENIDAELGKLLECLEKTGQMGQTLIVFSSDHGDMMGAHRCPFKGPMMYEELIKVPLIFSAPDLGPKGSTRKQFALNTDLFPTLCDLAGLPLPENIDGISLKAAIRDPEAETRSELVLQYYSKQNWINPIRSLVTESFKYNLYVSGEEELYNVTDDPAEIRNLADHPDFIEQKSSLRQKLLKWIQREHDPFFTYSPTDLSGRPLTL